MHLRPLGQTPILVSPIAFGCWQVTVKGDMTWTGQAESDNTTAIHAALDAGINLFDTAVAYGAGESEILLGRALAGRRSHAVIATKLGPEQLPGDGPIAACEASLQRLNTDYIDLYQIHWPNHDLPIQRTLDHMNRLLEQGKIRAFGVSNFGPLDLADLFQHGRAESNQLPYNLLFRSIEFAEQQLCAASNISILCYSPLAQGLLTGKFHTADHVPPGRARTRHFSSHRPLTRHGYAGAESETFAAIAAIRDICLRIEQPMSQVALAWCLHQPGITSVIAGARTPQQVRDNAAAAQLHLIPETLADLNAATTPLKKKLGHFSDPWGHADEKRWR